MSRKFNRYGVLVHLQNDSWKLFCGFLCVMIFLKCTEHRAVFLRQLRFLLIYRTWDLLAKSTRKTYSVVCFVDDRGCVQWALTCMIFHGQRACRPMKISWAVSTVVRRVMAAAFRNPVIATAERRNSNHRSAILDNRADGRWRWFRSIAGRYIDWRHIVSVKYAIIAPLRVLAASTLPLTACHGIDVVQKSTLI